MSRVLKVRAKVTEGIPCGEVYLCDVISVGVIRGYFQLILLSLRHINQLLNKHANTSVNACVCTIPRLNIHTRTRSKKTLIPSFLGITDQILTCTLDDSSRTTQISVQSKALLRVSLTHRHLLPANNWQIKIHGCGRWSLPFVQQEWAGHTHTVRCVSCEYNVSQILFTETYRHDKLLSHTVWWYKRTTVR